MNAPAEAFRFQALAKEIAAELRAKFDLNTRPCFIRAAAAFHNHSETIYFYPKVDRSLKYCALMKAACEYVYNEWVAAKRRKHGRRTTART